MGKPKRPLTKREVSLLILVFMVALSLTVWKFAYLPLRGSLNTLREKVSALQVQNGRLEHKLGRTGEIEAEWQKWKDEEGLLEEMIPSLPELPGVLADLEVLLEESPVQVRSLAVENIKRFEKQAVVSFQMSLAGGQEEILQTLSSLERFHRLLVVDNVTWRKQADGTWSLDLVFKLLFKL